MNRRGMTLIETLISLCILALISLAGMEVFAASRRIFFRLDEAQERDQRAAAGLDRARLDIREAGLGLSEAIRMGLLEGFRAENDRFSAYSLDKMATLASDIRAGDAFVRLADPDGFASGREIVILCEEKGELGVVSAATEGGFDLAAPAGDDYPAASTSVLLLRKVEIFPDAAGPTLRRRVDGSSAQPLIEGAISFAAAFDAATKLCRIEVRLAGFEEVPYAAAVLAKNLKLVGEAPQ